MINAGGSDWLKKIINLDEQKLLKISEAMLLKTLQDKKVDRLDLDNAVKIIQGLANRNKVVIENQADSIDVPLIKIEFLPMKKKPKELKEE